MIRTDNQLKHMLSICYQVSIIKVQCVASLSNKALIHNPNLDLDQVMIYIELKWYLLVYI